MNSKRSTKDSRQPDLSEGQLIACHECDLLHSIKPIPGGGKALCTRCGVLLYKNIPNSLDKALALNLAAFMFFTMANLFPFISLKTSGRIEESLFLSGALALYRLGMTELGLLVFLTSFLFPFVIIIGMLYVLLPLKFGHRSWKMAPVYRMVRGLTPWSLVAVFMLGVLISIVKLVDFASVIPGISLYTFVGLMILSAAARTNMDPPVIWPPMKHVPMENRSGATAVERDLIGCHTCALLVPETNLDDNGHNDCPRCGSLLHNRKANSLTRTPAPFSAVWFIL